MSKDGKFIISASQDKNVKYFGLYNNDLDFTVPQEFQNGIDN